MSGPHDQRRYRRCFLEWVDEQDADLHELLQGHAAAVAAGQQGGAEGDACLLSLVTKNVQRYEDYSARRSAMAREDALAFFNPAWCTSLENSFLWIAGCLPSMSIRLLYVLCGNDVDEHLDELLAGVRRGGLGNLSAPQLRRVEELHRSTIKEEERPDARMATVQDGVADNPLVRLARNSGTVLDPEVSAAVRPHAGSLAEVLVEADRLRVATLRELVGVLDPRQAVELLVGTKQLHLSVHEWGLRTDRVRCGDLG